MGYTTRNNGNIKDYWSDDTENCFYITAESEPTISDLLEMAIKKWGVHQLTLKSVNMDMLQGCSWRTKTFTIWLL